jgi:hypothetical protein
MPTIGELHVNSSRNGMPSRCRSLRHKTVEFDATWRHGSYVLICREWCAGRTITSAAGQALAFPDRHTDQLTACLATPASGTFWSNHPPTLAASDGTVIRAE